jgi:hypothetical protein
VTDTTNEDKEIERLRVELDQERSDREEWMRQHAALDALCTQREAERDRLRADIVCWYLAHKLDNEATDAEMEVSTDRLEDIARAALKETGHD